MQRISTNFTHLIHLMHARSLQQPDQLAYIFLSEKEGGETHLSYRELDQQARAIGAQLQQYYTPGERALLFYPAGLDYIAAFFGSLYSGIIAVPVYPTQSLKLGRIAAQRLLSIVEDAQPSVLLTIRDLIPSLERLSAIAPIFKTMRWLTTDHLLQTGEATWKEPLLTGDNLAFLQYTSGSTSTPRGVMITHHNLLANSALIHTFLESTSESTSVSWLPLYHDLGLIGGMLQPLYAGFPGVLMSPLAFLQKPVRWLQAISDYQATISGAPNFAYELCVRKVTTKQRASLDLSHWKVAISGAEPIRADTLQRFSEAFAGCGFRPETFSPCYGLAEATLLVTGGQAGQSPVKRLYNRLALQENLVIPTTDIHEGQTFIGCGQELPGQHIRIVNPTTLQPLPAGEVGEIWVCGSSVAQGYWHNTQATAQSFNFTHQGSEEGPFLRTGDLGFIDTGELFITGRLKDMLIIRGHNYYPQDIEQTIAQCHEALTIDGGAVFALEVAGEEQIVVVQEITRHAQSSNLDTVITAIRQAVAMAHQLQFYAVVLIKTGYLPRTSSGKIQRYACRELFVQDRLEVVQRSFANQELNDHGASENIVSRDILLATQPEQRLPLLERNVINQITHLLHISSEHVEPQQIVSSLGLDSLMAVDLQHSFEARLHIVLPATTFLQDYTIHQIAVDILQQLRTEPTVISPSLLSGQDAPVFPLSQGQRGLWLFQQLAPESAAYTVARAFRLHGRLDVVALQHAVQRLVDRHSALRTSITLVDNESVQCIREQREIVIEHIDTTDWEESHLHAYLTAISQHPFNLEHGPLFQVSLLQCPEQAPILVMITHHLIVDNWSFGLMLHELQMLYKAECQVNVFVPPPPSARYADFVFWQKTMLESATGEQHLAYWHRQLAGELSVLQLPFDHSRPATPSYRGSAHTFALPLPLVQKLRLLARTENTTLYMLLLATFQTLLYRYSGQEDIIVGSPMAARGSARFADIVGYFTNSICLRTHLAGDLPFRSLLKRVRQTVLEALDHQDYPFALLVEQLRIRRDPSISPLFQVMFVLEQVHTLLDTSHSKQYARLSTPLGMERVDFAQSTSQFDLSLLVEESQEGINASLQYCTDLFTAETITRMAGHWQMLLEGIVAHPDSSLSTLPLLTDQEQQGILAAWNQTWEDPPVAWSPSPLGSEQKQTQSERKDNEVAWPEHVCLHEVIERQARLQPNAIAVVFQNEHLTYRELDRRSTQLASSLAHLGVKQNTFVGICLEASLDLPVGLLGILKAGGTYVPLDPNYPQERLASMMEAVQMSVLVTQQQLQTRLPSSNEQRIFLDSDWQARPYNHQASLVTKATPDDLIYAIYTSGSTGEPKGAGIYQRGFRNLMNWFIREFTISKDDCVIVITSLSFDLTQKNIFAPLMVGGKLSLLASGHYDPEKILQTISEQKITLLNCTPSAFYPCIKYQMEHAYIKLASLRHLFLGGEPINAQRLSPWILSNPCQATVINTYGPTECTDIVAYHRLTRYDYHLDGPVPIGKPIPHVQLLVLDEQLQLVPVGVIGELYIAGESVGAGYINEMKRTRSSFIPNPFRAIRGSHLYKTGDHVCYQADGTIRFIARVDSQVKIRGFRVELGEVELHLLQCSVVRETIVQVHQDERKNMHLIAYLQIDGEETHAISHVRAFLHKRLPEYMIPTKYVVLASFPLNSNGKIDRKALPDPLIAFTRESEPHVTPRTAEERAIIAIWQEVLHCDEIGILDNFFMLGGYSLLAAQVTALMREQLQIELPVRALFEHPTVAELAAFVTSSSHSMATPEQELYYPVSRNQALPVSFIQERRLQRHTVHPVAHILTYGWSIKGELHIEALRESFAALISRHEVLRTTFLRENGEFVQNIAANRALTIPIIDVTERNSSEKDEFVHTYLTGQLAAPMNLEEGPLLRVALLKINEYEYKLFCALEHMIFDVWSKFVLTRELSNLYEALVKHEVPELPELSLQYADYAYWERKWLQEENSQNARAYWLTHLKGKFPELRLQPDFPPPQERTYTGNVLSQVLPDDLTQAIRHVAKETKVSLFMFFLAAFQLQLHYYTREDTIGVVSFTANRDLHATKFLLGWFANPLVFSTDISGNPAFLTLLERVRHISLEAHQHQNFPFPLLVELLRNDSYLQTLPIIHFQMHHADMDNPLHLPGLEVTDLELAETNLKVFNPALHVVDKAGNITIMIAYETEIFAPHTIMQMLDLFQRLLELVIQNPEQRLDDIRLQLIP